MKKSWVKLVSIFIFNRPRRKVYRSRRLTAIKLEESRRQAAKRKASADLSLYYHDSMNNFGDMLSHDIVEYVSGGIVVCEPSRDWCEIAAIGSILQDFMREDVVSGEELQVWGCGFIHDIPVEEIKFNRNLNVHALRGKLTQRKMLEAGYDVETVPLGDPGLLASEVFKCAKTNEYDIGVILHFVDVEQSGDLLSHLSSIYEKVLVIDILAPVSDVMQMISSCRFVVSSAMHGLIAADSLGVVNQWIRVSDDVIGGDFKFKDYYSALGIDNPKVLDVRQIRLSKEVLDSCLDSYRVTEATVRSVQASLKKVFPVFDSR